MLSRAVRDPSEFYSYLEDMSIIRDMGSFVRECTEIPLLNDTFASKATEFRKFRYKGNKSSYVPLKFTSSIK